MSDKNKHKRNKKRWLALFIFVAWVFLLYLVFRSTPVQTFLAKKAAKYVSERIGTEVSIGGFDLSFFMDIIAEDVMVKDKANDTLFFCKNINFDFGKLFLRNKHVIIDELELKKASVNLIKHKNDSLFNYIYILRAISGKKEKQKDIDTLTKPWTFEVRNILLNDLSFVYQNKNKKPVAEGMDYDNIRIQQINAEITDIYSHVKDSITARIEKFSAIERSGLKIYELNSNVLFTDERMSFRQTTCKTLASSLDFDLTFKYNSFDNFSDFIDSIGIEANIRKSKLHFDDLVYFSSEVKGMHNEISVAAQAKGTISNLKVKNINIQYGRNTVIEGSISMNGLPEIDETYSNLKLTNFQTDIYDLARFQLPLSAGIRTINLPKQFTKLGYVKISGVFAGFLNDFAATSNIRTNLGTINTDISLRNEEKKLVSYKGYISSKEFDMGTFVGANTNIGKTTFTAKLIGSGIDLNTIDVKMDGNIQKLQFNDYEYENIAIVGALFKKQFNGSIKIDDDNIGFNFDGTVDFNNPKATLDFTADIKHAALNKLKLIKSDTLTLLSSNIQVKVTDLNLDSIKGNMQISNTRFDYGEKTCRMNSFSFHSIITTSGQRIIQIQSDYIDALMHGTFLFSNISKVAENFLANYLPSALAKNVPKTEENGSNALVQFMFNIKNPNTITQIFFPSIKEISDFNIVGSLNSWEKNFTCKIDLPNISYNDIQAKGSHFSANSIENALMLDFTCDNIFFSDSLYIQKVELFSKTFNDNIDLKIQWANETVKYKNAGNIDATINFISNNALQAKFNDSKIYIKDTLWQVNGNKIIHVDSNAIIIDDVRLASHKQLLVFDGKISKNNEDTLFISFKDFNLSDFDEITANYGFDLNGNMNGKINISGILDKIQFGGNILIRNFAYDNDLLGDFVVNTQWIDENKSLELEGEIIYKGNYKTNTPLTICGNIYPYSDKNNLDLKVDIVNLRLSVLKNYFSSFSSRVLGNASGHVFITGAYNEPKLNGFIKIGQGKIKIDYLNTYYTFADTLFIEPDRFIMKSWTINDSIKNNAGILDGIIQHNNFSDFLFNMNIQTNNCLVLNTTIAENNLFYGKAFFTGVTKIKGDVNNIILEVVGKAEKGSKFYLPLYGTEEITDNNFIQFKSNQPVVNKKNITNEVDLSGIQLYFDLEVTPETEAQIIFDPKVGDIMKGHGRGNLKFEINTLGDFKMYGDYTIEDGEYLFTLLNSINKRFKIQKNSTLTWNGDPYEAIMNVEAIYKVKTSLYDLRNSPKLMNADTTKRRVPVDCKIILTDRLFNPNIAFDIDFPTLQQNEREQYREVVNAEVNKQVLALLVLNHFIDVKPENGYEASLPSTNSNAVNINSSELISNQLSNWLSQISNDFDIGINYRPGDAISSNELEVALSTQLFNDRVIVDGNVGTSKNNINQTATSNIVGDANVEIKLTEDGKYRLKAFYKSNAQDVLNTISPYTQGVGVFYRREFDHFKELFQKNKN